MDRRVTPRKRVTSPTWGPPPPCKQALTTSPSRGALSRDYWVVAKHVNKTMAGKSLAPRWVTPHLSCKREQIKMSDYKDRQLTLPKWVTSPTWGPPPPCKKGKRMWSRVSKKVDLLIDWLTDHSGGKVSEVWLWKRRKLKALSSGMFTHCFFFHLLDCGLMKISYSIITRIRVFLKT